MLKSLRQLTIAESNVALKCMGGGSGATEVVLGLKGNRVGVVRRPRSHRFRGETLNSLNPWSPVTRPPLLRDICNATVDVSSRWNNSAVDAKTLGKLASHVYVQPVCTFQKSKEHCWLSSRGGPAPCGQATRKWESMPKWGKQCHLHTKMCWWKQWSSDVYFVRKYWILNLKLKVSTTPPPPCGIRLVVFGKHTGSTPLSVQRTGRTDWMYMRNKRLGGLWCGIDPSPDPEYVEG